MLSRFELTLGVSDEKIYNWIASQVVVLAFHLFPHFIAHARPKAFLGGCFLRVKGRKKLS